MGVAARGSQNADRVGGAEGGLEGFGAGGEDGEGGGVVVGLRGRVVDCGAVVGVEVGVLAWPVVLVKGGEARREEG